MGPPPDPERRARLLAQVRDCLLRRGLMGFSLRAVAAEVGIPHRTLLHHFGSKEQMLVEVIADLRRGSQAAIQVSAGRAANVGLRDDMDRGWRTIADFDSRRYLLLFGIWVLVSRLPS